MGKWEGESKEDGKGGRGKGGGMKGKAKKVEREEWGREEGGRKGKGILVTIKIYISSFNNNTA